jgi:exonuclease VII large subunit
MPGVTARAHTSTDRSDSARRLLHVGELGRLVEDQFHIGFPRRIWVTGRVSASRTDPDGDRRFGLVEARPAHEELTLPCLIQVEAADDIEDTLRRLHDASIDDVVVNGHVVRAGGLLTYDFATHRIVFTVTALDPEATAGDLYEVRRAVATTIGGEGLAERQHSLSPPLAPLRLALVAPHGDPSLPESVAMLDRSGFAVDVSVYDPVVTGNSAVSALASAIARAVGDRHDMVLLLRAPGRPLAAAAYDSERVARTIAAAEVPVLTGIVSDEGTVADAVAHQAHRSAAAAVQAVVARLQRASAQLNIAMSDIHREADAGRRRAAQQLVAERSSVREAATRAKLRAERARARRHLWARAVGTGLVVALALAAVLTRMPLLIVPIVLVVAAVLAEQFGARLRPSARKGWAPVSDLTFADVLDRLGRIRTQLEATSSPEEVLRLEAEAEGLVEFGQDVLQRRVARPGADLRPVHMDHSDLGMVYPPGPAYLDLDEPTAGPLRQTHPPAPRGDFADGLPSLGARGPGDAGARTRSGPDGEELS